MKTILTTTMLLLSLSSFADDGLTIPNSHKVGNKGFVFRGREPKGLVHELAPFGITDVIIFKNDVKGEVEEEKQSLEKDGINVHAIPFHWKDFPSMVDACEQVLDALEIIKQVGKKKGKVFFHCTAGEDRTGMLAGIYRMKDEKLSRDAVFKNEMCARGYSDGNPNKPTLVTKAIEKDLTPLFVAMADLIQSGKKVDCQKLVIAPTSLKCRK